ncbi:MAG: hypothetical protein ACRC3Y_10195 [Romboutsia sp.]|uniref:hypothetical protein n=1 Tax=Romboutsia sp. TaxID=1965302 RepID=UPI003F307446
MENDIYKIYQREIEKIIENENVKSIFLVGSTKDLDLKKEINKVNDIDIFVFIEDNNIQIREIKNIDGIEFDINYFSQFGLKKMIDNKEYFFLKEMYNPKVVYDRVGTSQNIIDLCKDKFIEGPNNLSQYEKSFIKSDIKSKIDRLKDKEKLEIYEYEFLTNIYLKDIIIGYFIINKKWIPKDKKLMISLKKENLELFNLVQLIQKNYKYEDLLIVYEYIFKNIEISKNIKITY